MMNQPTSDKSCDAILLVGEGESSFKVYHQHKAFLRLNGKAIVSYVIRTLQQVPSVQRIFIVGNCERLRRTIEEEGIDQMVPKPLILVQQRNNLYQNIWHAFKETLPEKLPEEALENSPYRDRPVLIVPCDSPLITPHEIEYFINQADTDRFDHILGLVSEEILEPFYPKEDQPGIRMAYLHLKEKKYRINNLHMVKPLRIGHRHYIQEMYQYRYQRDIKKVLPFAFKLLLRDRYGGYRYYIGLILSLLFAQWGFQPAVNYFRSWVPRKGLEEWISKGLDTRFTSLEMPFPGAALDIDNDRDFEAIQDRFEDWRLRLRELNTDYPLPAQPAQKTLNGVTPDPSHLSKTMG